MKNWGKCMMLFLCILLITGCGNKKSVDGKDADNVNSVDKVIKDQMTNENSKSKKTESVGLTVLVEPNEDTEARIDGTADVRATEETVDYDLTKMGSDMVYATIYQLMVAPEEYEGKTFRIDGKFYAAYYEATKKYYFYCVIQDATACCTQGLDFGWEDGSHIYPDEYPEENAEIVVEGTFERYKEEDQKVYCRLAGATLQQEN